LKISIAKQPITFAGYLKSNNCSVLNSGLAIEIARMDCASDKEKIENFIKSKNWKFFVTTCDSYGFMIDYNVPWRIVADIGSKSMLEQASKYGNENVESILDRQYYNASISSIKDLGKIFYDLYNNIRQNSYYVSTTCQDGTTKRVKVKTTKYKLSDFFSLYDEKYFVDLYLKLRLYEEKPHMPENQRQTIIRRQNTIFNKTGTISSITNNFESIINKTFDKQGSLTYNVNSDREKVLKAFDRQQLDNITISGGNSDISGY